MTKLSIITINYNNASGLRKTMESVLAQTSKDFEYIVIDGAAPQPPKGGVSDRAVIESYVNSVEGQENGYMRCSFLSSASGRRVGGGFFSESDNGIYHAMNKGIRMAQGEYIHFLNSGDWLVDKHVVEDMLNFLNPLTPSPSPQKPSFQSLSPVGESTRRGIEVREGLGVRSGELEGAFSSHNSLKPLISPPSGETEGASILVGNVIAVRPDGKVRYKKYNPDVSLYTFYRGTIEHTSAYIRRDLFDKYGLYDENLKIVSDWKWYLQVVGLNKARVQFTDRYVTCFDTSGISSTNLQLDKSERRRVLEELLPAAVLADYDKYAFDIDQMQRLKRYPLIYRLVWFVERVLFKLDKWNGKYWGWKKM